MNIFRERISPSEEKNYRDFMEKNAFGSLSDEWDLGILYAVV